jgi:hypothetical protein
VSGAEFTTPPAATGAASPRPTLRGLFPTKAIVGAFLVVCVLLPGTLVVQQIRHNPSLSPADEFAHLDYVVKVADGKIPRMGERIDPRVQRIVACAGIDYPGTTVPPCDFAKFDPALFPNRGYNHEAQQPPLYYAITAALRGAGAGVSGSDDLLATSRATGLLWLWLALLVIWVAGRLLGANAWALLAALLVLVASPAVIYYSSIVSNDAPALLSGALVLLAYAWVGLRPGRWGSVLLFGAAFIGAAFKPTNGLAALALSLFAFALLARDCEWRIDRSLLVTWLRVGGALVGGVVVAVLGWTLISSSIALVDARTLPIYAARRLDQFHPDLLLEEATNLLWSATHTVPPGTLTHHIQVFTSALLDVLYVVVALAGLFVARRAWYHVLGLASLATLLLGGFGYGLVVWATLGMDPGTGSRYGLCVLPLLTVCLAKLAQQGRVVPIVAGIGALTSVTTLWVLR